MRARTASAPARQPSLLQVANPNGAVDDDRTKRAVPAHLIG